jgi:hypothetical protein
MISNLLYSQVGYPRLIVSNGDTVVAITRHQMEQINIAHQTWLGTAQENDSLLQVVDSCTQGFHDADSIISIQHSIIQADGTYITQQTSVIDTLQHVIADQRKTIRHLKVHRTLSTIGEGVLGIIVAWLLLR